MDKFRQRISDKLKEKGFKVFHYDLPDFLVSKDGVLLWIATKNYRSTIRANREKCVKMLNAGGFPAVILCADCRGKLTVLPEGLEVLKKKFRDTEKYLYLVADLLA